MITPLQGAIQFIELREIQMSLIRTLFWFSGRMNRREFATVVFGAMSALVLGLTVMVLLDGAIGGDSSGSGFGIFALGLIVICKWVVLAALAKRLHDANSPGLLCLLALIPLLGLAFFVAMFFVGGTRGDNSYGRQTSFFQPHAALNVSQS